MTDSISTQPEEIQLDSANKPSNSIHKPESPEIQNVSVSKPPLFFRLMPVFLGMLLLLALTYLAIDYFNVPTPFELPHHFFTKEKPITTYEECEKDPRSRIQESYPATCIAPGGTHFIQPTPTPTENTTTDTTPTPPNATAQSLLPLINITHWKEEYVTNELAFFKNNTQDVRLPGMLLTTDSDNPWTDNIKNEEEFIDALIEIGWKERLIIDNDKYVSVFADGINGSTQGLLLKTEEGIQALWISYDPQVYQLFLSDTYPL